MAGVRVAVFSDDRLFCEGIIGILTIEPSFAVRRLDRLAQLAGADVDVLLIDSRCDGALDGCASTAVPVLLIAAPGNDEWCRDALCAGASGVLPKDCGADALRHAVHEVFAGSVWAPRRVISSCIKRLSATSPARRAGGDNSREHQLSRREREIFLQAATGLANKELASRFDIGEATVKAHLTRIFQKLGVRGRAELAALYHGVVPPHDGAALPFIPGATPMVVRRKSNFASAGRARK